jgi:hypothetical protein
MTYRVQRHDNTRIAIERDGKLAFELEREHGGRGFWALFPVYDGKRGARITTDQYANDLVEWVSSGFVQGGHIAVVEGGFVVPVPREARDFYISGTGYLCCRQPVRMVLTEHLVTTHGIRDARQIRAATAAEKEAAGLAESSEAPSAVFLAGAS